MPKQMRVLSKVSETIRRGRSDNISLNGRLVKYKRREKEFSLKYARKGLCPEFEEEAKSLGEDWIGLIVDLACKEGENIEAEEINRIRTAYTESVLDSLGKGSFVTESY